jgi:hypothetical protein
MIMCDNNDMAYLEDLVRKAEIGEATLRELCPEYLFDESSFGCVECSLIFACRVRKGVGKNNAT